jgi:hypothetical protein
VPEPELAGALPNRTEINDGNKESAQKIANPSTKNNS